MGLPLAEYRVLRPIRESARSRVYEAIHERDGHIVIAKVFDIEDEADEDRVQREFELIRGLDIDGVVRALDLRRVGDQLVLLLERVPGQNLAEFAEGQPLSSSQFWPIAIEIAEILARTHAARVVHRDIKPANILINSQTGRVCLADFGISVLLENERRHIYDSEVFVGTLPYISPEQTGRTSRAVDFRSDLYSLGVTFYELLTGSRPFESLAPLDLIHAHLAREPDPLVALRSDLPIGLSRLVMKLLAKAPEHRYQTAAGLANDLRRLRDMNLSGADGDQFELGRDDRATVLRLPHQLYGREHERTRLVEAFAEVVGASGRKTIAITGTLGVGKSALAGELAVPVAGRGGYLVRGEFGDGSEGPLSGFRTAFTALFEQLLTESDARLDRWRRLFVGGLGNLVGVIAEFIPTFALVIGQHPLAQALEAGEARNRLLIAVERMLTVICSNGPLVLVLDDIHRAGQGAAQLLEGLIHGRHGPLLVLLTYRNDELCGPSREALVTGLASGRVEELELAGISSGAVISLVADALSGADEVDELARTIARRTNGVPLFVNQLLAQLAERGILRSDQRRWIWDQAAVEAEPLPEDAVSMMRAKLDQLPERPRELLAHAACVGVSFEPRRLVGLTQLDRGQLGTILLELEDVGVLVRSGASYRFSHPSIRAAALERLDPPTQRALHWRVGRELQPSLADSDELLFEVVDHLDAGAPAQLGPELELELAQLDRRAGQRALETSAYDLAERYYGHGLELLRERVEAVAAQGPSAPAYELVYRLESGLAYVQALAGHRAEAERAFTALLEWPLAPHHYAEVVARRLELLWAETRNDAAVALGLSALERLGLPQPGSPTRDAALATVAAAWAWLEGQTHGQLEALPRCVDPHHAGIVDVVAQLKFPAFATNNALFLHLAGIHVELTRRYGYHATTPKALSDLAIGVSGALGEVAGAVRTQDLACSLARADARSASEARLLAIGGALTLHRGRSFSAVIDQFSTAYPQALEVGEFDSASFLGGFGADMQLETGTHLRVLERRCGRVTADVGRWCPNQMRVEVWQLRGVCRALQGGEEDDDDEIWDLDIDALAARKAGRTNYYVGLIAKAMLALVFGDSAGALELCARYLGNVEQVVFNTFYLARAWVVACAAYYVEGLGGAELSAELGEQIAAGCASLERWARDAPENYGHYLNLVLGLRHAASGRPHEAVEHLDHAWEQASRRGCRWIQGVAAEQLAGEFRRQGLRAPVDGVLVRVWDAYYAWGAEAKLAQLRRDYPEVFTPSERRREVGPRTNLMHTTANFDTQRRAAAGDTGLGSTPPIDLAQVLRSVGAISEDLRLEEVISRVLDAALTNVGADHGLLILDQGGELVLAAEADTVEDREIFSDPMPIRDIGARAPTTLINFVARTGQSVVLDDAREDLRFAGDPYLERDDVRSILAMPLLKGERRLGVLVLENHLTTHGFGSASIETLRLITSQAASTLENAQLYGALRRSEARWRSLVDGAPDLIALLDERGAVVFRNHAGPLRGVDETDDGADEAGALEPLSSERWREAVQAVLADGERRELELEYRPSEGAPRWYAVRIAPIEVHRGLRSTGRRQRRNAVAVATDVSARKQAEAEKRGLEAQLRQQQRLESVGTLASGVAHEINNPIQGIMNYADLIYGNSTDRELVEDFASEINVESQRVAKIVRNLLKFSRQDATEDPEPADLVEVVEGSLSLIRAVLRGDHITVTLDHEGQLPPISCRPQQIQQVIMNLVTNARDALNERYGEYHERKRIELTVRAAARPGWAEVRVRDYGPGIPRAVLARIYDPFFTTKGRDRGTGLGLAVSHGIVRDHGGELRVETEVGAGTCFILELPLM